MAKYSKEQRDRAVDLYSNADETPPMRSESSAIPAEARCGYGARTGSSVFR